ncbi:MAG: alpha/beta hydrolase [Anaerolineales bacterium]|nr:alpha/beta hydrolase [Anaerolineales bacterium]
MPTTTKLYYFAHEAEDQVTARPPVILIHGAGGTHLSWPPQIRRLADEKIYALDLPGHGKSEDAGRQSIDEYADDVIAFMDELKMRVAVIVGHSLGSAVALTLALKYPKQVLGLGLLGSGSRLRVSPILLETAGNPNTFESAVEMVNGNCFCSETPQNLIEHSKRTMLEIRPPVLLGDLLACNEFDVTSQLDKITVPTLIICGAEDKMTPLKFSELLQSGIANSQLHVLDKAGHMVMLEQPDAVADLLKQFIDNIPFKVRKARKKRIKPNAVADPVP